MLKELFISKVRVAIIKLFLAKPSDSFHVREISRRVGAEINAVRRELNRLEKIRFLKKNPRGNRLYYSVRPDFVLLDELYGMVAKDVGLGRDILNEKEELGKISFAVLAKPFVKGRVSKPSEVDLLLVGKVDAGKLERIIRREQERIGREINYTVLTPEEFGFRQRRKDTFLLSVLQQSWVVLLGSEEKYCRF
jgi:DNA-binding transcriptional ArsR family regulator